MLRRALDWLAVLSLALAVALGAVWASHILPRQFHLRFWWRSSNPTRPAFEFASSFNYLYFERYRWNDQPVPGPIASDHFTQVAFEARFGGRRFYDNALRLRRWTEPLVRTSPDGRLAMHGTLTTFGLPFGYPLVLLMLLPTWRLLPMAVRRLRAGWRKPPGFCERCGYDLRASPGRCPECGLQRIG